MVAMLLLLNALIALAMVILILLQRSDPSGGGVFGGSSANQPVVRNPLARPTAILAALFMVNCVALAYFGRTDHAKDTSLMGTHEEAPTGQTLPMPGAPAAPLAPVVVSPAQVVTPAMVVTTPTTVTSPVAP